jgi:hypothetical protein
MKKMIAVFLLLVLVAPPAYCADKRYVDGYPRTTANENNQTVLAPGEYTTLVAGAQGKSRGFLLLGILPLWFATQSRAMNNVYESANVNKSEASLANVYQVRDHYYFILGTITTRDITADVVKLNNK